MFTVLSHGIPRHSTNALSPAQYRLLTDPAPIRVCGAPTGAGKTYAFLQAARQGNLVLFVVPTQALAKDIEQGAAAQDTPAYRWDGAQSAQLREAGLEPWIERKLQLDRLKQSGGLVVTTPETLGAILLGKPQRQRSTLTLADFLQARHIVFDEAHTLTVRALGFLHFWAVLAVCQHRTDPVNAPKLTLLSATHSNLFRALYDANHPDNTYIPPSAVTFFDETIEHDRQEELRMLHGDVIVEQGPGDVLTCVEQFAGEPLTQGHRLLVLYDSLYKLTRDEIKLRDYFLKFGVQPENCFLINGQDRKAGGKSIGDSGFEAGLHPQDSHRVIIATSCIEAGVNLKNLRYAILDPGLDAAALLQRIGRVARGSVDGKIWLTTPERQPAHLLKLTQIQGSVTVSELYQALSPLRELPLEQARRLGSAYWSMLKRKQPVLYRSLLDTHGTLSEAKAPGAFLNSLHTLAQATKRRTNRDHYLRWLEAVDKEICDLRGFAPSVLLQFADYPIIEYSRDWAQAYLEKPESIDNEGDSKEVWRYRQPRTHYLRDQPRPMYINLLCPSGDIFTYRLNVYWDKLGELKRQYVKFIKNEAKELPNEDFLSQAADFVGAVGILVRVRENNNVQNDTMIL